MVLDASVVVKFFMPEPQSELAKNLIESNHLLLAPDIIRIEVASAITRKTRNRQIPADMAYEKLQEWREYLAKDAIRLISAEELLEDAENLSIDLRHPLKDCLYLAAADRHNATLVTADQPFAKAAGKRFKRIKHLSDFATAH